MEYKSYSRELDVLWRHPTFRFFCLYPIGMLLGGILPIFFYPMVGIDSKWAHELPTAAIIAFVIAIPLTLPFVWWQSFKVTAITAGVIGAFYITLSSTVYLIKGPDPGDEFIVIRETTRNHSCTCNYELTLILSSYGDPEPQEVFKSKNIRVHSFEGQAVDWDYETLQRELERVRNKDPKRSSKYTLSQNCSCVFYQLRVGDVGTDEVRVQYLSNHSGKERIQMSQWEQGNRGWQFTKEVTYFPYMHPDKLFGRTRFGGRKEFICQTASLEDDEKVEAYIRSKAAPHEPVSNEM